MRPIQKCYKYLSLVFASTVPFFFVPLISCNKEIPQAFFSMADTAFTNHSVFFYNETLNGKKYYWNFGDGFTSLLLNPVHKYKKDGKYKVTLIVKHDRKTGYFERDIVVVDFVAPIVIIPPALTEAEKAELARLQALENSRQIKLLLERLKAAVGNYRMYGYSSKNDPSIVPNFVQWNITDTLISSTIVDSTISIMGQSLLYSRKDSNDTCLIFWSSYNVPYPYSYSSSYFVLYTKSSYAGYRSDLSQGETQTKSYITLLTGSKQ